MNHDAFKQFLADNATSVREFEHYCHPSGLISTSTIHRLTKPNFGDGISPTQWKKIGPHVIRYCQRFLEDRGKPVHEINRVLEQIFEEAYEPMMTERSKLDPEMIEFFNLDRDPFAAATDPRNAAEVLTTKELDRIVRIVEMAVKHQDFICVLGDIGCGKSTLKARIADRLRTEGKTHLIFPKFVEMGKLNAAGIVHFMLEYFGQKGRIRLPLAQVQLERHLQNLTDNGQRISLFIDEVHRLSNNTLTALKNFLEMGTGGYERFLSVICFGQPRFKAEKLENIEFREIAERVQVLNMPSMAKYAADYIAHRVRLAGGDADALFEPAAVRIIAAQSGSPLAIGNLANRGLIEAYKKGEPRVLARFLEKDTEPETRKLKSVAGGRS
ncbi:MAG: AAA family ATPase [Acidobacteria bacterium]|nr:AAA family ATPase [Acidobacteriota bacterium]